MSKKRKFNVISIPLPSLQSLPSTPHKCKKIKKFHDYITESSRNAKKRIEKEELDLFSPLNIKMKIIKRIEQITIRMCKIDLNLVKMIRSKREILLVRDIIVNDRDSITSYSNDDLKTVIDAVTDIGCSGYNIHEVRVALAGNSRAYLYKPCWRVMKELMDNIMLFKKNIKLYIVVYNFVESVCTKGIIPEEIMIQIKKIPIVKCTEMYMRVEGEKNKIPRVRAVFRVLLYLVRMKSLGSKKVSSNETEHSDSDETEHSDSVFTRGDEAIDIMYDQRKFIDGVHGHKNLKRKILRSDCRFKKSACIFKEAVLNEIAHISKFSHLFPKKNKLLEYSNSITRMEMISIMSNYCTGGGGSSGACTGESISSKFNLTHVEIIPPSVTTTPLKMVTTGSGASDTDNINKQKMYRNNCFNRCKRVIHFMAKKNIKGVFFFKISDESVTDAATSSATAAASSASKYVGMYTDETLGKYLKNNINELDGTVGTIREASTVPCVNESCLHEIGKSHKFCYSCGMSQ